MEIKEAIHKLKFMRDGYLKLITERVSEGTLVGTDITGTWSADTPLTEVYKAHVEACNMAISALEKQVAIEHHHTRVRQVEGKVRQSVCPTCLGLITTNEQEYPKYCVWCGRKIDWQQTETGGKR